MYKLLVKTFKWYIMALLVVAGMYGMVNSGYDEDPKMFIAGFAFLGTAYILTLFWKNISGKLLFNSLLLVIGFGFISSYIPMWAFVYLGIDLPIQNPYLITAALCTIPGYPFMMWVFHKYDDD